MVNAMFAVLIAGSIGYVLSGWVGMAVGAIVASVVAVLTESLTPLIEQGTSHERRMRGDRRYRSRFEALEDSWRRPYPRSRRAWLSAMEPTGKKPAVAGPAPADPMLVAVDEPELPSHVPDVQHARAAPGQLETSWSQRPRGDVESRCTQLPRRAGSRAASRRVEAKAPGVSARSKQRLSRGMAPHPRSRLATAPARPERSRMPAAQLLRMPYRFDRIRRLR